MYNHNEVYSHTNEEDDVVGECALEDIAKMFALFVFVAAVSFGAGYWLHWWQSTAPQQMTKCK